MFEFGVGHQENLIRQSKSQAAGGGAPQVVASEHLPSDNVSHLRNPETGDCLVNVVPVLDQVVSVVVGVRLQRTRSLSCEELVSRSRASCHRSSTNIQQRKFANNKLKIIFLVLLNVKFIP